jgi:hypothetical protein
VDLHTADVTRWQIPDDVTLVYLSSSHSTGHHAACA